MIWDYFSRFWSQVSDVITGGITYTAQFFQNIGNAVAGAIGSFFDVIFHNLNDIFVFLGWLASSLKNIFLFILSPVEYFFTFLKTFFSTINSPANTPAVSYSFSTSTLEVFNTIPHFDVFLAVLGAIIVFLGARAILKLLLNT